MEDSSQATVDVAIDETEAPLLKAGEQAAINSKDFPPEHSGERLRW